jgi:hypothetical protein
LLFCVEHPFGFPFHFKQTASAREHFFLAVRVGIFALFVLAPLGGLPVETHALMNLRLGNLRLLSTSGGSTGSM